MIVFQTLPDMSPPIHHMIDSEVEWVPAVILETAIQIG
jgi:hypothetical protein